MKQLLLIGANGYVGSYLQEHLRRSFKYSITTCDIQMLSGLRPDFLCDYEDLPGHVTETSDAVLFFAGCSSVKDALVNPIRAIEENVFKLGRFAQRLRAGQRLIYASSGSVYSVPSATKSTVALSSETSANANPTNAYDAGKLAFDVLAGYLPPETVGLRMGTVSGYSPNLRNELVFNAMVESAIRYGRISLSNPTASRSILFLEHLSRVVEGIVDMRSTPPPILNVASLSTTFAKLAESISTVLGARIVLGPSSDTYNFELDISLMKTLVPGPLPLLENEIEKMASDLRGERRW
jgi:UDP-glucose 4-epimerase